MDTSNRAYMGWYGTVHKTTGGTATAFGGGLKNEKGVTSEITHFQWSIRGQYNHLEPIRCKKGNCREATRSTMEGISAPPLGEGIIGKFYFKAFRFV